MWICISKIDIFSKSRPFLVVCWSFSASSRILAYKQFHCLEITYPVSTPLVANEDLGTGPLFQLSHISLFPPELSLVFHELITLFQRNPTQTLSNFVKLTSNLSCIFGSLCWLVLWYPARLFGTSSVQFSVYNVQLAPQLSNSSNAWVPSIFFWSCTFWPLIKFWQQLSDSSSYDVFFLI